MTTADPQQTRTANQPFQHEGEWRSYDTAGRLLRWDERTQVWLPVASEFPRMPSAMPAAAPTAFASLKTPALWVYITLGLSLATVVLYFIGAVMQYSAIGNLQSGDGNIFSSLQDIEDADDVISAGLGFQALATIATAGVFIWWTRRATCNVSALGAADPQFTPGWAVGWWFIPLANLVQPLRVINQAWRASDPAVIRSGDPSAWKSASVGGIVITWWVVWLIGGAIANVAYGIYDDTENLGTARDAAAAMAVGQVVTAAAAVLAIIVVRQLTRRHEVAAQFQSQM